ncbi:MAG TPA: DmsC/YnfH family molybdoenzyme membrane anchor subunit, partial [Acidimicrobiales bacterium]|nr:DmsC/YnfH family molybdoenzyme membrane anchor subunit [Acidimicrobiales bacterium]
MTALELRVTPDADEPVALVPALLPLNAGEQYRFAFAVDACVGCHSCEVACAEQNGLPVGTAWRRVGEIEGGSYPTAKRFHLSMACHHCLEPACLAGCPTEAYVKLSNGIVEHHADECIGCQYCTWNCPYSVPAFQPDRRIVTKCDLCQPRLATGLEPACVGACPTHALTVETVDVAAWRADHRAADAPRLPPSDLTISTTRIELPDGVPLDSFSASDWDLRPEHAHWPLVWLTMLTQIAVGVSATANSAGMRLTAAVVAALALLTSVFHLGRPIHAWKALRNLRRSWLSREVALFAAYTGAATFAVVVPKASVIAVVVGAAGVYASGRLYVVPGRPAWNTPLTPIQFGLTALAIGPLITGTPMLAAAALGAQILVLGANLARLGWDRRPEWRGTVSLMLRWFRPAFVFRLASTFTAITFVALDKPRLALPLALAGELLGRWLFFVTVVPLSMPGSITAR